MNTDKVDTEQLDRKLVTPDTHSYLSLSLSLSLYLSLSLSLSLLLLQSPQQHCVNIRCCLKRWRWLGSTRRRPARQRWGNTSLRTVKHLFTRVSNVPHTCFQMTSGQSSRERQEEREGAREGGRESNVPHTLEAVNLMRRVFGVESCAIVPALSRIIPVPR